MSKKCDCITRKDVSNFVDTCCLTISRILVIAIVSFVGFLIGESKAFKEQYKQGYIRGCYANSTGKTYDKCSEKANK